MKDFTRKPCAWSWFALATVVGVCGPAAGQQRRIVEEEPQPFKLRLNQVNTGVYSEGIFEETSYRDVGGKLSHQRYFFGPTVGMSVDGSIYHPYLFHYQIENDGAFGYSHDSVKIPGGSHDRTEWDYLGHFQANADILASKPYRGNIFGGYDHATRDYDFFNRVNVDSWRYGARATYQQGGFHLGANYLHRDEEVTGWAQPSIAHDDVFGVDARHERAHGNTSLNYSYNQYNREDAGNLGSGKDHSITGTESEVFGAERQFRLNTIAAYHHREATFETSDQVNSQANLEAKHRENLSSWYDLGYDRYQSSTFASDNYRGRAELRHQLFSSLSSRLILQASDVENSDQNLSGYTRRYGGGFAEGYIKQLGPNHRLRLDNSLLLEHVDQHSLSLAENERHSFTEGLGAPPDSFFLNLPNVIEASIVVRDSVGIQQWLRGLDYEVVQNGSRTLIQRIGGSRIPASGIVLVDYRAEPTPAGGYEHLSEFAQVRFELCNNMWGLYGRFNFSLNNAPSELRVQNLRSYTFGTDFNWRWLRAGAEYIIYDSDQSEYNSLRLFQSFSFRPDDASSLSLNFSQTWTDYLEARRKEQDYRFIARYWRTLNSNFKVELEGGIDLRRGVGVEQTLATVRPGIQYNIGKFSLSASYDFEYNLYLRNEERIKHMFLLRAKRDF